MLTLVLTPQLVAWPGASIYVHIICEVSPQPFQKYAFLIEPQEYFNITAACLAGRVEKKTQ